MKPCMIYEPVKCLVVNTQESPVYIEGVALKADVASKVHVCI